jgi:hypothetical protein
MRIIDKDGCLTIRTRSGLYRFNVLPLGISPAVSEFQRAIEMLLGEELMTSKVRVYLDDIIIFSNSLQEHSDTLDKVLTKLEAAGLKLKREKCKFAVKELKFLGYVLSTEGVSLDKERIQALIQAPRPRNCSDVRGFLGGLLMLRRFDPRIAEFTKLLNPQTGEFNWGKAEDEAFAKIKELIADINPRNWKPELMYPFIVETDASTHAVGASLIQEIPNEDGEIERRLIYASSRSFKGPETRYSTIRRELLGIVFAVSKFKRFLLGRQFEVRTDHRPLVNLLEKPLLSIENERLRDLVECLSAFKFQITYIQGEHNVFPDWLSRNCISQLYEYPEFRNKEGKDSFEVIHKGTWKDFIPAADRRNYLNSLHSSFHYGYNKMITEASNANFTWPGISEDIKLFLSDCSCALSKKNRRKTNQLGEPTKIESLIGEETYALDLYTFGNISYLSILKVSSNEYWCIPVAEKTAEEITSILQCWSDSLGLQLNDLSFLTDRGGEFAELSIFVKNHVRTAAYSPQSNGQVERVHRELGMMCRLYQTTPDRVAEFWRSGKFVAQLKVLPEVGSLFLRFVQRKQSKTLDLWTGPYVTMEHLGNFIVKAYNLETKRSAVVHLNDIKLYERPSLLNWKLNEKYKSKYADRLDIDLKNYQGVDLNVNWKGKDIYVDICDCADLEEIILKACKDLPNSFFFLKANIETMWHRTCDKDEMHFSFGNFATCK